MTSTPQICLKRRPKADEEFQSSKRWAAAALEPAAAIDMLGTSGSTALLVDVRSAEDFDAKHIDGAVNWPADEIRECRGHDDVPPEFRDKTLLMICDVGYASVDAARLLQ